MLRNLLRRIFADRRKVSISVMEERRGMKGGPLRRMRAVNDRMDAAADSLYATVIEHTDKIRARGNRDQ
jgi:hypothetical protein